jgi:phosphatidylserine synthase 2
MLSIGFELMELTFQHMLPNFNECWWDSWILDVAVCNFIGIYTGMKTVNWARAQNYNWTGLSQQATLGAKAKRSLLQFTPYSWDDFQWRAFSTPLRCLQTLGLLTVFLLMEVNAFFLKYVLWVPPLNPLNTIRLAILFLAALPTAKEYYAFIDDDSGSGRRKLGFFAWLYCCLAVVETAVVVKFGRGMFPTPWPAHVLWFWGVVGSTFTVVMLVWMLRIRGAQLQKAKTV